MSLKDEIAEVFEEEREPLYFFDRARPLLREACGKDGKCDPSGPNAWEGYNAYMFLAD